MKRTAIWSFGAGLVVAAFYTVWFWLAQLFQSQDMIDFLGTRVFLWPASVAFLLLIGTSNNSIEAWLLTLTLGLLNGLTYLVVALAVRDLIRALRSSKVS